ncbi:lamin tail domain-containing protein [Chryseobacterium jejuense]|uniref:Lamin Tail Domain n=1 Tax=Chryseobacterium jejuense TaxID=445960 RepID=A0ABY0Q4E9_CHRJE|nr:lamin tail domain-containing protein [Chryseobacterium jejuense]SDJ50215.1 Lamin Tail Domain [Chryseobacterium jejuense]
MKIKYTASFFLLLVGKLFYSQIMITEVYWNTPYNEKLKFTKKINGVPNGELIDAIKHHRGEFVEIYNYSDRDLNLKNWTLYDYQSSFQLPDKIIKSGQFVVIAYSTLPYNTTPFSEYFTTTAGKEDQIILQDKIILRNKRETLSLGYVTNDGVGAIVSKTGWDFRSEPKPNFIANLAGNPSQFYTVKSIQYHPDPASTLDPNVQLEPDAITDYQATPNPLAADFVPPIQKYEDLVKNIFQESFSSLDWGDNVDELVNKTCLISIEQVSQAPTTPNNPVRKCFSYDAAGNFVNTNCGKNVLIPPIELIPHDLDEIKNNIKIFPNPTKASEQYNVTISWSGPALDKIQSIQIFNSTGSLIHNFNFTPTQGATTISFSLQNQLPGTFVANFVLINGQVISKNILRW